MHPNIKRTHYNQPRIYRFLHSHLSLKFGGIRGYVLPAWLKHTMIVDFLGTPSPRSSRRWSFEISVTGAVPRHGVINWEEFGEKFWWVVLHSQWSTKMPRKLRPKFRPIFRPILRPGSHPVIKICRHNFALGNVSRKIFGWGLELRFCC